MFELFIAILGIVVSAAISQAQMDEQSARASHETQIRNVFDAVKNKLGVSIDQLNQLSDKMGINLERLTNAARGSARLSDASRLYREYVEAYPGKVSKINQLKNTINNEVNRLNRYEESLASSAQTGARISSQDIGKLTQKSVETVNKGINEINTSLHSGSSVDENKVDDVKDQPANSTGVVKFNDPYAGV